MKSRYMRAIHALSGWYMETGLPRRPSLTDDDEGRPIIGVCLVGFALIDKGQHCAAQCLGVPDLRIGATTPTIVMSFTVANVSTSQCDTSSARAWE